MDRSQFNFIKDLVAEGKSLTALQLECLVKKVAFLWNKNDELTARMFSMAADERDLLADRRHLHDLHHADGVQITQLREKNAALEAERAALIRMAMYLSDDSHLSFANIVAVATEPKAPWNIACRVCGCTWFTACPGGCSWAEPDLCSACAGKKGAAQEAQP